MADDDHGLEALTRALDRAGVAYWVDSGVLLGLRRSGALNPWEKDIDLAIIESSLGALLAARPTFEELGYEFTVNRYRGRIYAVGLEPTAARPVDDLRAAVHVFYREHDHLWSPQTQMYVPPPSPDVYEQRRSPLGTALRHFVDRRLYRSETATAEGRATRAPGRVSFAYRLARTTYRSLDRGFMAETWPIREIFVPLTWVVPADLVLPLSMLDVGGQSFPVPRDLDGYLTYRYGDWRTPVEEWCYWEDDGAIVKARPQQVLTQLRAGTLGRPD